MGALLQLVSDCILFIQEIIAWLALIFLAEKWDTVLLVFVAFGASLLQ